MGLFSASPRPIQRRQSPSPDLPPPRVCLLWMGGVITKMIISQRWRRSRHQAWMRFKRRNVLYVPGVELVHGSPCAPSSARQRHSRGPPPPRWCPPQEASCTSPSATTKTGQGTHLSRGSMSFTNALRRAAHCGPSDMECTLTFPYHQEFLKKSSGEQSYDLERDRCRSGTI